MKHHNDFTLNYPPKIVFAVNSILRLPEYIPPASKIMLVSSDSFARSPQMRELDLSLANFAVVHFPKISYEAPLPDVERLVELGRRENITAVIAIGGGSVIDAGKIAAGIIPSDGTCTDYFYGRKSIPGKGLFFAAAPTTAGSGAEMTANAVLTDPEKQIKQSIRSAFLTADLAIIDPLLTVSMPPRLTASSGFDAFTQAIESYVSELSNPLSNVLAEKAIALILNNLHDAFLDGKNILARTGMAEGSLLSAMAFSQSGLGAAHGLAHPVGSLLSVPHGLACAILIPHIIEWNNPVCGNEYDNLGIKCGFKNSAQLFSRINELKSAMHIPTNFSSFGLHEEHFDFIIRNCRSRSMQTNPRKMTDPELRALLEKLV